MILQALYKLSIDEKLIEDPDYEQKVVQWIVKVDRGGQLLEIVEALQTTKITTKLIHRQIRVPRQQIRTKGINSHFFCDKAEYVFGIEPRPDEKTLPKSESRLIGCMTDFRRKIKLCADETGDEGATAVLEFLNDVATGKQIITLPENCCNNDLFAFVYAPDVDVLIHHRQAIHYYWKQIRTQKARKGNSKLRCLVSGKPVGIINNFPQIRKVPGKRTTTGVSMVSFNSNAFESYGWRGNNNAPISRAAAESCATALDRLLNYDYTIFDPYERILPRRNILISSNTILCYWANGSGINEFCDSFAGLLESNISLVDKVYHSIWRGEPQNIDDSTAFYVLTLSGTMGRIIFRYWFESTIAEVANNISLFFKDINIVCNTPNPKGHVLPPSFPLYILLESIASPATNRKETIPVQLAIDLVHAALSGRDYPIEAMKKAIQRYRTEIGQLSDEKYGWSTKYWNDARAAIIKAVLNRRKRSFPNSTHYRAIRPELDLHNDDQGYMLGRLMSYIEGMRQTAINNFNISIAEHIFISALASPKSVFPMLMIKMRNYARTARKRAYTAGKARWIEAKINDMLSRFNEFPEHLALDDQGLFIIGYHHQKNCMWSTKAAQNLVSIIPLSQSHETSMENNYEIN